MPDLDQAPPEPRLRVAVAEEDLLTREGVCRLLESSGQIEVVTAVSDADALRAAVADHRPSAVLTEGADGLGYLLKERVADRAQLVQALRETSRGGSVVDPVLVDILVRRRRLTAESGLESLTPRELGVLQHMAVGLSNAASARSLSLSESSVENASNTLFAKLGLTGEPTVHRRVSAVVTYLRAASQSQHLGTDPPRPAERPQGDRGGHRRGSPRSP